MAAYRREPRADDSGQEREERLWRDAVYELALAQVLADDAIQGRTKQIFVRTAVTGEKPEAVAESFGISRNAVDQAKSRMVERLRDVVSRLEAVDAGA